MALALTITPLIDIGGRGMGRKVLMVDMVADATYPTGGYGAANGFTLAALKLRSKLEALIPCGFATSGAGGPAVVPSWDKRTIGATNTAGLLKLTGAAGSATGLTEIGASAAISTQACTFLAIGY